MIQIAPLGSGQTMEIQGPAGFGPWRLMLPETMLLDRSSCGLFSATHSVGILVHRRG